jgi:hypothetical protein
VLNTGYCGAQSLEFRPFFLWQIPFNKIRPFGENGNYVSKSFFSTFKSTSNQSCTANLITPTGKESQKLPFSVSDPTDALTVNVETMSDKHSQHASESRSADGFNSWNERLAYLWGHFITGLLSALIALFIYRRIQIRKQSQ